MLFNMVITIKNCSESENLWHKINRYCQSMVADVGDKTFVTFAGRYEDAEFVFGQCIFHGDCEVSINQKRG